jgi:opacity protein-like surface antigen
MRSFVWLLVVLESFVVSAAPGKRASKPGGENAKQGVVLDAPPAMAKLLQNTLSARFRVSINREALSDAPTSKEVRAVTSPTAAIAVVLARATGNQWTITVLNGADGAPLETQTLRAASRKPLKALPKSLAGALLVACANGEAPNAPVATMNTSTKSEPTPAAADPVLPKKELAAAQVPEPGAGPAPAVSTSPSSTPSSRSALPAIRAGLGFRAFGRSLTWSGDPDQALARYALPFAPAVAFDATWYPGAHFTSGIAANLGVAFTGDIGVGISSKQDTSRFGTRCDRFRVSGAFRQPFGSIFSLEVVAGFATQTFSIAPVAANDGSARPNIPSVTFSGPRGGLGVRLVKLGPVGIDVMGGFTFLTSTGELGTDVYFRRAGGFGVDAGGGLSIDVVENIQVRAGIDWTRYLLSLRPEEGARFTAPSAVDQYLGGSVALHWVM